LVSVGVVSFVVSPAGVEVGLNVTAVEIILAVGRGVKIMPVLEGGPKMMPVLGASSGMSGLRMAVCGKAAATARRVAAKMRRVMIAGTG
jgi:hypothetical protein